MNEGHNINNLLQLWTKIAPRWVNSISKTFI